MAESWYVGQPVVSVTIPGRGYIDEITEHCLLVIWEDGYASVHLHDTPTLHPAPPHGVSSSTASSQGL